MLRITKNMGRITSMSRTPLDYSKMASNIDSLLIIPNVTNYSSIYSIDRRLVFVELSGSVVEIEFVTEGDLERFFSQLMREVKLSQILDINIDKGK